MENVAAPSVLPDVQFKTVQVENLSIFYRESGDVHAPAILFLHGFPSSSHMYRDIMADLSAKYHLIAPDYPGFGLSSLPSPDGFAYTFDHLAELMEKFIDTLELSRFSMYVQDYGGPVGFRIAAKRPELIQALIIQNANAYEEGFGPDVLKIRQLEQSGDTDGLLRAIEYMISYEGIKEQYVYGAGNPNKVSPDGYLMDHFFMERPGMKEIQTALFQNYRTNFPQYANWQRYFREHQPPALIVWGKNDPIFTAPGAQAYQRDLPDAELHLLEGSHFALEEHHRTIAELIDRFLAREVIQHQPKG